MELWLVRHGQTEANSRGEIQGQTESPLDATGISQAKLLVGKLKKETFDAVYSSDLGRALNTARILAPDRIIEVIPELREWALGNWEGRLIRDIQEEDPVLWKRLYDDSDLEFWPGGRGESRREMQARVRNLLESFAKRHGGEKILVISHGGFLRAAFRYIMGNEMSGMPLTSNTSLNILTNDGDGWKIVRWNDLSHLRNMDGSIIAV